MHISAHIGFCECTKNWVTHLDKCGAEHLMAEHWLPLSQLQFVSAQWICIRVSLTPKSAGTAAQAEKYFSLWERGQLWQHRLGWGYKIHPGWWLRNGLIWCATARALLIPLQTQICLSQLPLSSEAGPPWGCIQRQGLALTSSSGEFFCLPLHPHVHYIPSAAVLSEWLWSAGPPQTAPRYQCGWTHQSTPMHQSWARKGKWGESGASHRSKLAVKTSARSRNYKSTYWGGCTEPRNEHKCP